MANEIWTTYQSGFNLYAIVRRQSDDTVNVAGTDTFETWADGNILNYDVPMADNGGGYYTVDFPATILNVDQETYRVDIYLQPGANPVITDFAISQGEVIWADGEEIDLGTINITNQTVTNIYEEEVDLPGVQVINETINV